MDKKEFGMYLRAVRENSGKNVSDISKHLISMGYKAKTTTIYGWENGTSQPTPDAFLEFCVFCGVDDVLSAFGYKKVPIQKQTGEDVDTIRKYNALDDRAKARVKNQIDYEYKESVKDDVRTPSRIRRIGNLIYLYFYKGSV